MSTVQAIQTRDLTVRSYRVGLDTVNRDERSVESVMATEEPVWVMDMRTWEPIREVLLMDGAEFDDLAPLLDSHDRSTVKKVLGSTREIHAEGGKLIGRNFFAADADSVDAFGKVADGHVRDNSIGYQTITYTDIPAGESAEINGRTFEAGDTTLRVTTKWRLRENSLTPIGADPNAKFRKEIAMAQKPDKPADDTKPVDDQQQRQAPADDAQSQTSAPAPVVAPEPTEQEVRRRDILAIAPESLKGLAERCILENKTVEQARAAMLEELAKRQAPAGTPEPKAPEGGQGDQTRDAGAGDEPKLEDLDNDTLMRSLGC